MNKIHTILSSILVLATIAIITQQQASAQDGWTSLLKIAKNFTDTCRAEGHTDTECTEMFKNIEANKSDG